MAFIHVPMNEANSELTNTFLKNLNNPSSSKRLAHSKKCLPFRNSSQQTLCHQITNSGPAVSCRESCLDAFSNQKGFCCTLHFLNNFPHTILNLLFFNGFYTMPTVRKQYVLLRNVSYAVLALLRFFLNIQSNMNCCILAWIFPHRGIYCQECGKEIKYKISCRKLYHFLGTYKKLFSTYQ